MENICCINWVKVKMPKVTLTVHLTLSGPEGRNDWQRDDQSAYNRPQIYIVMYKQLFIHTASSFLYIQQVVSSMFCFTKKEKCFWLQYTLVNTVVVDK